MAQHTIHTPEDGAIIDKKFYRTIIDNQDYINIRSRIQVRTIRLHFPIFIIFNFVFISPPPSSRKINLLLTRMDISICFLSLLQKNLSLLQFFFLSSSHPPTPGSQFFAQYIGSRQQVAHAILVQRLRWSLTQQKYCNSGNIS